MAITLLEPASAQERLRQALGFDPATVEGLADLLRAEVHARGRTQHAQALQRVHRLILPVAQLDEGQIAAACESLIREGDLVLVPGGVLAATPLRAVPLAAGSARLFSSLPTDALFSLFGAAVSQRGATRSVTWQPALSTAVEAVGGRVLTPEVWAGLDRAPRADDAFLATLEERLKWAAESAGSLERDGPLEWRGWIPNGEAPGWRQAPESARLWMARTSCRGHRKAWTGGTSPSQGDFVSLTADEADRAALALSRNVGASQKLLVEREQEKAILTLRTWLPRPEYRWLSLQAEPLDVTGPESRWRILSEAQTAVTATLAEHLGLTVEER